MKEFFGNIKQELDKITWPTNEEMKSNSLKVFVFMIVLGLFFAGVDAVISAGVSAATGEDIVEEYNDFDDEFDLDELLDFDYDYEYDDYDDYYESDGETSDED